VKTLADEFSQFSRFPKAQMVPCDLNSVVRNGLDVFDGRLEGMQTFDSELERLINADAIDREVGLSYATNRTNLQLRLDNQGAGATEKMSAIKAAPPRSSPPSGPSGQGARKPSAPASEFDDLIER